VHGVKEVIHIPVVAAVLFSSLALGQVGGGAASFGNQRGQSGADAARAAELAKRVIPASDGKYIDAAVLMNVEPDEYVAMFGISTEGKTLADAQQGMDDTVAKFTGSLTGLRVPAGDIHVDFVSQNRIYGFEVVDPNLVREYVVGFEVKKTVSIRYKDKRLLDKLTGAAGEAKIFDLVKVDYVVRDFAPLRRKLMEEAGKIVKAKVADQQTLLGVEVGKLSVAVPGSMSVYYPIEMYESYVAQEAEEVYGYRNNMTIQRMRKPRTFYYNPMLAKDFDSVINPSVVEPCVQVTIYVRVKY